MPRNGSAARRRIGKRRKVVATGLTAALGVGASLVLLASLPHARTQPPSLLSPTPAQLAEAKTHFDAGYQVAGTKDFTAAAGEFSKAAELAKGGDLTDADNLEVRARFQEAIAVQAAGDTQRAAQVFQQFAKDYPDHYLAARALERAEEIVVAAHSTASAVPTPDPSTSLGFARDEALGAGTPPPTPEQQCGPQALAYALHRLGIEATAEAIAAAAGTDNERGTSFAGLAKAAEQFGATAKGLLVDDAGLKQAPLPAIAWVDSDHFVVIETAGLLSVRFWDPLDQRAHRLKYEDFHQRWQGYVLTLQRVNRRTGEPGNGRDGQ